MPNQVANLHLLSEEQHQVAFFDWVRETYPELIACAFLFHVPNGGLRHRVTANKLMKAGVVNGVSDIISLLPLGKYHGFICELKRIAKALIKPNPYQQNFLDNHGDNGYYVTLASGWIEAKEALEYYLNQGDYMKKRKDVVRKYFPKKSFLAKAKKANMEPKLYIDYVLSSPHLFPPRTIAEAKAAQQFGVFNEQYGSDK